MTNPMINNLLSLLSPFITSVLSSNTLLETRRTIRELSRKLLGASHEVLVFHKVDDPYSHLLLQMLQQLMGDFDIKIKPVVVSSLEKNTLPEPELLAAWSLKDVEVLAQSFELSFPDISSLPSKGLCLRAEKILLACEKSDSFLKISLDLSHALWNKDEAAIALLESEIHPVNEQQYQSRIKRNQKLLTKKGHYSSAMLYYSGEWYWGIDRIQYLVKRLSDLGIAKTSVELSNYTGQIYSINDAGIQKPNTEISPAEALDFYFSFRSPYSYLACQRIKKLKDSHSFKLNIKPVLPMVMRGLPVPKLKRMYIILDTKRECERHSIPFGKIVDPLGEGVNRCMSIYPLALKNKLELEYICSISQGIWSEGKDVSKDSSLQELCERAGLSWKDAKPYLSTTTWRDSAETNRLDMNRLGFWGVPSFQYGDQAFWGQDRLWILERKLQLQTS